MKAWTALVAGVVVLTARPVLARQGEAPAPGEAAEEAERVQETGPSAHPPPAVVAPALATSEEPSTALAKAPARPADAGGAPVPPPPAEEVAPTAEEGGDPSTAAEAPRPRLLTLVLAGTSTWRSYCAAPGVGACAEYAVLSPDQRAAGRAVSFATTIPYTGGSAQLELFPLVLLGATPLQGLGLLADFGLGASSVSLNYRTEDGAVHGGTTRSADRRFSLMATYRHHFAFRGPRATLPGYVGVRAGYLARHFLVAREVRAQLPSSRRGPIAAGLDVSVPLARLARLEASGLFLLLPQPDAHVQGLFGREVRSQGFGLELGLAGDISGPLGYQLRYRMLSFHDRFTGAGSDWTGGGVADEVYSGLTWGLTLGF